MTLRSWATVAALAVGLFLLGACGDSQPDDDASSGGCFGPSSRRI